MKLRFVTAMMLGWGVMAAHAIAQTTAEEMQRAIYYQDTAGNLDAAIQIYRQILTSAPTKENAAQAQFRLAEALLEKGDLNGAAQEFQMLAQGYPDSKDLIAAMAKRMQSVPVTVLNVSGRFVPVTFSADPQRGILADGHFRSFLTNVDLTIPAGYKFAGCTGSSDDGDMAFVNSNAAPSVQVWMKSETTPAEKLDGLLRAEPVKKATMRDATWKIRQQTIEQHPVNGRAGLSAVADYSEDNKQMVEYFLWVRTGKTHLQFFGQAPPDQLPALEDSVDRVANSAAIP